MFTRKLQAGPGLVIFEDLMEDQEVIVRGKREVGGRTLLGRPARRIPGHAEKAGQESESSRGEKDLPLQAVGQARRRTSMAISVAREGGSHSTQGSHGEHEEPQHADIKKEPRRRTIFVPTDDTSLLTIHPGAHTTLNDTFNVSFLPAKQPEPQRGSESSRTPQALKRPRMSLAAGPKRLPLREVAVKPANSPSRDLAGQNGGKENAPPGGEKNVDHKDVHQEKPAHSPQAVLLRSSLHAPTAASQARQSVVSRNSVPLSGTSGHLQRRRPVVWQSSLSKQKPREIAYIDRPLQASLPRTETPTIANPLSSRVPAAQTQPAAPGQQSRPLARRIQAQKNRLQQYPVLSEDLAQPELYEDGWLSHQEVALTELVNHIFSAADSRSRSLLQPDRPLRERLIDLYHQPVVKTLHKRLQASLLYGALSRPKDLPDPPSPARDIGLRKRFLSMWLQSYDPTYLRAAAEVVFGRQLPRTTDSSSAIQGTIDPHKSRRALIGSLETFLVEVDDVEAPDEKRGDDPNGRWRKTILRSFMLIWLLDQAKASGILHECLFMSTSPWKSSMALLHAVAGMLIPSTGDITRLLHHVEYEVSHSQDPLDEVSYRIENIAVDLRDGILLTKLTELLLFPTRSIPTVDKMEEATITFQMPDLTMRESVLYDADDAKRTKPLSQHLKMPCLGRVQKTFNVQIALSALECCGKSAIELTADDIVNGHKEKTLSLLWTLVSEYGLAELLDFGELAADIKRTTTVAIDASELELGSDRHQLSQAQQEDLLKVWALSRCAPAGITISNLTTSFADGRAYAAILNAFSKYIDIGRTSRSNSSPASQSGTLEAQLRSFGCSNAFIEQLSFSFGIIPSRKTTISNLAFLASRLLPLAKQHNAATVIQRAFRRRQLCIIASQRATLLHVAQECAKVVQTQQRLVAAATVLQRAWRRLLDTRLRRVNAHVTAFQVVAHAWIVRRRLKRTRSDTVLLGRSFGYGSW